MNTGYQTVTSMGLAAMTSNTPAWQLRLLGSGVGAFVPAAVMLITIPTIFLAIIAGFGIPVGVFVGAMFAPRLVAGPRNGRLVLRAGWTAFLIGSTGYA